MGIGAYFIGSGEIWASPVFYSLYPLHPQILNLNSDPMSYSEGIRWYTASAVDPWGYFLLSMHGEPNDGLVGDSRAKLSFALSSPTYNGISHGQIANDPDYRTSYDDVFSWLTYDTDSDGDGLKDSMETYIHGTNPNDWDSDDDNLSDYDEIVQGSNPLDPDSDDDTLSDYDEFQEGSDPNDPDSDSDGLLDGWEVHTYNTLPTAWSTDGDILSDGQEIAWGYNPLDTDDPIDADHLTYSAWQIGGTTGYVRANHYAAMDYVKVYVRYMTSTGVWKPYNYVGIDYTPYYSGDYYVSWSLQQGYVQMQVKVEAYNPWDIYLGCDTQIVAIPGGGGGPPIE